jgi:hypothetical protein
LIRGKASRRAPADLTELSERRCLLFKTLIIRRRLPSTHSNHSSHNRLLRILIRALNARLCFPSKMRAFSPTTHNARSVANAPQMTMQLNTHSIHTMSSALCALSLPPLAIISKWVCVIKKALSAHQSAR